MECLTCGRTVSYGIVPLTRCPHCGDDKGLASAIAKEYARYGVEPPQFSRDLTVEDLAEAKRRFRANSKKRGTKNDKTIDSVIAEAEKDGGYPWEIITRLYGRERIVYSAGKAWGGLAGLAGGGPMAYAIRETYDSVREKPDPFIPLVGSLAEKQTSELERQLNIRPSKWGDVKGLAALAFLTMCIVLWLLSLRIG